jgi:2-oxo-3-hexenedioate decarboxylase/2-keto-4-pentenoate hydratase
VADGLVLSPEAVGEAAACIHAARQAGRPLPDLPPELRPASLADGYAVQEALLALIGETRVGFKIGATSKRAQAYLEIDHPFYGQVPAGALHESPARLPAACFVFALAEPEFALTLGRDLPPKAAPFDLESVAEAVAALHPAIELVTSVWEPWTEAGASALIADNGVNGALILGEGVADWRRFDLATHRVSVSLDGTPAGEGTGANALGHPMAALAWLANERARQGKGLKAGEIVSTGVVTPFHYLDAGSRVVADFGALGQVTLDLAA